MTRHAYDQRRLFGDPYREQALKLRREAEAARRRAKQADWLATEKERIADEAEQAYYGLTDTVARGEEVEVPPCIDLSLEEFERLALIEARSKALAEVKATGVLDTLRRNLVESSTVQGWAAGPLGWRKNALRCEMSMIDPPAHLAAMRETSEARGREVWEDQRDHARRFLLPNIPTLPVNPFNRLSEECDKNSPRYRTDRIYAEDIKATPEDAAREKPPTAEVIQLRPRSRKPRPEPVKDEGLWPLFGSVPDPACEASVEAIAADHAKAQAPPEDDAREKPPDDDDVVDAGDGAS